ncbi:hypothetical protein V1478_018339 [Vespula squamosa]|uniref:Uncharacterized protein n=1 Tax=Vespula squamosa TaxID=30214 RepID=A0ABD1ZUS2_VESSQ
MKYRVSTTDAKVDTCAYQLCALSDPENPTGSSGGFEASRTYYRECTFLVSHLRRVSGCESYHYFRYERMSPDVPTLDDVRQWMKGSEQGCTLHNPHQQRYCRDSGATRQIFTLEDAGARQREYLSCRARGRKRKRTLLESPMHCYTYNCREYFIQSSSRKSIATKNRKITNYAGGHYANRALRMREDSISFLSTDNSAILNFSVIPIAMELHHLVNYRLLFVVLYQSIRLYEIVYIPSINILSDNTYRAVLESLYLSFIINLNDFLLQQLY